MVTRQLAFMQEFQVQVYSLILIVISDDNICGKGRMHFNPAALPKKLWAETETNHQNWGSLIFVFAKLGMNIDIRKLDLML